MNVKTIVFFACRGVRWHNTEGSCWAFRSLCDSEGEWYIIAGLEVRDVMVVSVV